MVKKKRNVKKYTVYDIDNNLIGTWYNTKDLMTDLCIKSQTYISDSVNKGVYIRPYKRCKNMYLIKLEKYTEIYYVEGANAPIRTYIPLPTNAVPSKVTPGLYVTKTGKVFGSDSTGGYYEIRPYPNKYNNIMYETFSFEGKTCRVHTEVGRTLVDGYEPGYVIIHIDGDPLNNNASNLKWISRAEEKKLQWDRCTPEDKEIMKEKYIEGVKRAHKNGVYKEHYTNLKKKNTKNIGGNYEN